MQLFQFFVIKHIIVVTDFISMKKRWCWWCFRSVASSLSAGHQMVVVLLCFAVNM